MIRRISANCCTRLAPCPTACVGGIPHSLFCRDSDGWFGCTIPSGSSRSNTPPRPVSQIAPGTARCRPFRHHSVPDHPCGAFRQGAWRGLYPSHEGYGSTGASSRLMPGRNHVAFSFHHGFTGNRGCGLFANILQFRIQPDRHFGPGERRIGHGYPGLTASQSSFTAQGKVPGHRLRNQGCPAVVIENAQGMQPDPRNDRLERQYGCAVHWPPLCRRREVLRLRCAGARRANSPCCFAPAIADAGKAAAHYFLTARTGDGRLVDPVARFHLGNGARLERLDFPSDASARGLRESHGSWSTTSTSWTT